MSLATLDDPEALSAADPGGMLRLIGTLGAQLRQGFDAGIDAGGALEGAPSALVVCGMGGSGIAGDLVRAVVDDRLEVPMVVRKGYRLPAFCGPGTLVVALSYSGNTEETLATYGEATARGCAVVAVASGGDLLSRAAADGVASVRLPADIPMPRSALGHLAGALLGVVAAAAPLDLGPEVADAVATLDASPARWGPAAPEAANEAKALAAWLRHRVPVIWGSEGIAEAAAQRWKTQCNENAKAPAFWGILPEVDHNEVEGWSRGEGGPFGLVVLRHRGEHPRTEVRVRATLDAVAAAGLEAIQAEAATDSLTCALFSLVMLGDYVSTYLALLRGVDPTPVPVLSSLKERLRS
jgi:glucose/mannose-6-phosphate isomerase